MRVLVYCESLVVPSTGTPTRGMLKKLIEIRNDLHFLLVFRKNSQRNKIVKSFLLEISALNNWELVVYPISRFRSNLLGLLRFKNYCNINLKADLYFNLDCNSLGKHAHPLIIVIADLSSFKSLKYSSYKRTWQLILRRFMIKDGINNSDKIISISNFTKQEIASFFPESYSKISVVHNGISDIWFDHPFGHVQLNKDRYWIWWGMITSRKNLTNLLEAYGNLRKDGVDLPDIKIIYGNTMIPSDIGQLVQRLRISNYILFERSKNIDDLIDTVTLSDGLVFPSLIEGFGMPVVEAFSRGIPVLTSSTSALKEISGGLAVLVNPEDTTSIQQGLLELNRASKNPDESNKRKSWAQNFSLSNMTEKVSSILHSFKAE